MSNNSKIIKSVVLYPWYNKENKTVKTNIFYNINADPKRYIYPHMVTNLVKDLKNNIFEIQKRAYVKVDDNTKTYNFIFLTKAKDGHFAAWTINRNGKPYDGFYDENATYELVPYTVSDNRQINLLTALTQMHREEYKFIGHVASETPVKKEPTIAEKLVKEFKSASKAPETKETKKAESIQKELDKAIKCIEMLALATSAKIDKKKSTIDEQEQKIKSLEALARDAETRARKLQKELDDLKAGKTGRVYTVKDTYNRYKTTICLEQGNVKMKLFMYEDRKAYYINSFKVDFNAMLNAIEIAQSKYSVARKMNDIWDIVASYYQESSAKSEKQSKYMLDMIKFHTIW